jgi:hypothetical protein
VAATGLLGFNPYGKSVALDFSSKPTQLAIQLGQREQAKREALEKSFMDYEKSINPAGMRKVDSDVFLQKLAENKSFYLQNRDRILNPAKYGYDAQSQFMSNNKGLLGLIDQSKQAAANEKIVNQNVYQAMQKGKTLHDGLMQELDRQKLSVVDPNYKTVDAYALQFDNKYDDVAFTKNVWGGLTLPTKEVPTTLPSGKVQYTKTSYLTPDLAQTVAINAINEYKTKPENTKNFNNLMKDANIFSAAEKEFGEAFKYTDPQTKKTVVPKIENPEQFVAGYALLKKPTGELSTGKADYPWLTKFRMTQAAINDRADKRDEEMGDPVDAYLAEARSGKTFAGESGNASGVEIMNLPETILRDLGKNKRPAVIGRGLNDNEFYSIVFQVDSKGNKMDLIDWTKTEKIPPSQLRSSVVARALPSGAKVKLVEGGKEKTKFVNPRKFN